MVVSITLATLLTGILEDSPALAYASSFLVGFLGGWAGYTVGTLMETMMVVVAGEISQAAIVAVAHGMRIGISFSMMRTLYREGIAERRVASFWGSLLVGIAIGAAGGIERSGFLGIVVGLSSAVGVWFNWWRPVLFSIVLIPWHIWLYKVDQFRLGKMPSMLHRHLAFWDEWQRLPIRGLDKHLLLVLEKSPAEGQAALDYLSTTRQRWAVQAVQIELDVRKLEDCPDIDAIGAIQKAFTLDDSDGPAQLWFRRFTAISRDVDAAIHQASSYNQRSALTKINQTLDILLGDLTRSDNKYAVRFRLISQRWGNIVALHVQDLEKETELNQEIDSPYVIGVPLTARQEIFVGRLGMSTRIEQLLLDRQHPPLLLYGQRRIGKTSLLNNLGQLLPNNIVPLFVDLQGPASRARNHAGFLYNLAKSMGASAKRQRNLSLPSLSREDLADDPFTVFDEWLDAVEVTLGDRTALLTLDEFEVLDQALVDGRFNEIDILGMLRNLIQHRLQFKVMLVGSHTLNEFQRWSSYLINAQVLHLRYLSATDTRRLVEQPCPGFTLRYAPAACQRIIDLTCGHPFLVQLLCAEIIALKNEQEPEFRRYATLADVEAAIPEALSSGSMFFSDIERNQLDAYSLEVLRAIATQGEGAIVSLAFLAQQNPEGLGHVLKTLLQRELLEQTDDGYRMQVELIRQWFDKSA
ncbi:MAG: AAA family ATPase [Cyanobacteria bacterium P01_F01_bin.150]